MQVEVGVSNRHIHLTKEDYNILFGDGKIEVLRDLVQTGQFATTFKLTIKTDKNEISNVRLLGPLRDYTQVEISKTDAYKLGINPPIRTSGQLDDACEIEIIGPNGGIKKKCCIIPNRHIHINHQQRVSFGLENIEEVSVSFDSEKSVIFHNVKIKETTDGVFEMHLDTDDANGSMIKNKQLGTIIN